MAGQSEQQSQITFGMPEEWEHFKERHPVFLDRVPNLFAACSIAFERTAQTSQPLDRVIYFSGRLCLEEFNEIFLLCGNGYGVAAQRLVLGMYERAVTARYLAEHPEETEQIHSITLHSISTHSSTGWLTIFASVTATALWRSGLHWTATMDHPHSASDTQN